MAILDSFRLDGQVAVVTGGGKGIGRGIALCLAEAGADVAVASRNLADLEAVVREIEQRGRKGLAVPTDVTASGQLDALGEQVVGILGAPTIWVNNAGIGYIMKPLVEVSAEDWAAVIDVNLTGSFNGVKAAALRMIAQGKGGRIINIASQAAKSGFPFAQAYCASKHGLVGLVRSAAIELGQYNITINNVCPNHVTTGLGAWQNSYFAEKTGRTVEVYLADMAARIPMGRPGLPEDTANAVAFLASEEARYITAESLNVSGGEEPH